MGFHNRIYTVVTEDGYILRVDRLFRESSQKTPVIMGSGASTNSMIYIELGNKSLAFFLANEGYDVWLINWRGTRFSRGHVSLSPNNSTFWQTGFHDMAVYDLKTISNFVYAETGRRAIYIGFSMGSTIALIYNIREQKSAERTLKTIIHLAPVATFRHSAPFIKYMSTIWPFLKILVRILWNGEVIPYNKHTTFFCSPFPLNVQICDLIIQPFAGINHDIDPLLYPVTNIQIRDSITTGTVDHYVQIIKTDRFEELSYGRLGNLKKYHQINPPLYEFSELTIPQIMFVGEKDILATVEVS
ncbi:hypothetical protein WA026_003823 [Henosepilachna vigintioctopunctata]|uniref:AB hydrolase-1 domain-containing protein n=1 Tax=Henosepilachna vigintioctopunctata TaxID=420089 RepID=A0AAW1UEC8_9CUCU